MCPSNLENRKKKMGKVKQNMIEWESRGDVAVGQMTAASLCPSPSILLRRYFGHSSAKSADLSLYGIHSKPNGLPLKL